MPREYDREDLMKILIEWNNWMVKNNTSPIGAPTCQTREAVDCGSDGHGIGEKCGCCGVLTFE